MTSIVCDYVINSSFYVIFANSYMIQMFFVQLIGVTDQSEKDEIVKSVMELRNVEVEEGYSIDTIASRQVGGTLC